LYEKSNKDQFLKLFCIHPAAKIKEALSRGKSAVFFSATLTPFIYFKNIFGCSPEAKEINIYSSFPKKNFCAVIVDAVSTYYPDREKTKQSIKKIIQGMMQHRQGNYLTYFSSYQYLEMIYQLWSEEEKQSTKIICQTPNMSEAERQDFLALFHDYKQTKMGIAVLGGVFGEGVDLSGEKLSGVLIVGVGMPAICAEREAIKEYYQSQLDNGFNYAYLYPGMIKVLQAAGRVIRGAEDKGFVILVDKRYEKSQYHELLPDHWQKVRAYGGNPIGKILDVFWRNHES
ncbi:MAG: ATP-dependent DNA helicase, partial [Spirochaetes bacterium]|nr:ATP-dependent DNA helicase [Spirochaetota bacterium]